jgi:hypothetical protein
MLTNREITLNTDQEEGVALAGFFGRSRLLAKFLVIASLGLGLWVRLGGDELPFPERFWPAIAWVVASSGVFFLARRFTGMDGALAALAICLFLPFGILNSRGDLRATSGIACLIWFLFTIELWQKNERWFWALVAGILAGLAGGFRVFLMFPVVFGLFGLFLVSRSAGTFWRSPQAWMILAVTMLLPMALALTKLVNPSDGLSFGWSSQVLQPWWIVRWLNFLRSQVNLNLVLLSILGLLLFPVVGRGMLMGGWLGYALAGILLSTDLLTTPSIHLILVPLAALSLAPVAREVFGFIARQSRVWQFAFSILMVVCLAYAIYTVGA